jgi:transposase
MNVHKGARTTPLSRADLVDRVLVQQQERQGVAADMGISERTVGKWVARFLAEGPAGLQDRSSRPHQVRQATPQAVVEAMVVLRKQYCSRRQIARQVG